MLPEDDNYAETCRSKLILQYTTYRIVHLYVLMNFVIFCFKLLTSADADRNFCVSPPEVFIITGTGNLIKVHSIGFIANLLGGWPPPPVQKGADRSNF